MRIGEIQGEPANVITMAFNQTSELRGIARGRYELVTRREHRLCERPAQTSGATGD